MPKFNRLEKPLGVYRIDFDDKYFYIGSSKNLKQRFRSWENKFTGGTPIKNININIATNSTKSINISVIELCTIERLRDIETLLISENWDNPKLLNRCPSGYKKNSISFKPYIGYEKHVYNKYIKKGGLTPPQKIARFDIEWNLLELHESKTDVQKKFNNCTINKINKFLKGEIGSLCGFKFKKISDNGSFIEPIPFQKRSSHIKDLPTQPKFYQLSTNNNIIGEFNNCGTAQRTTGTHSGTISAILNKKSESKSPKGYTYMYAEEYHNKFG